MPNDAVVSAGRLKSFVDRIERLEEEQRSIGGDKRDVYAEAKGVGYNPKIMRKIIQERRMDAADRAEHEALLDTYRQALGMAVDMVSNGEVSLRKAAKATGVSKSSIHRALAVPEVSQPEPQPEDDLTIPPFLDRRVST